VIAKPNIIKSFVGFPSASPTYDITIFNLNLIKTIF
jgi:hypothetical protein